MTQAISVISKDYALLTSDRRLTLEAGPRRGEVADDDTCELVSLCNTFGIGYSGLAHVEGSPTYEWIAKTLASDGCNDAPRASQILKERAARIFSALRLVAKIRQRKFRTLDYTTRHHR
jgi:hypothetical protein